MSPVLGTNQKLQKLRVANLRWWDKITTIKKSQMVKNGDESHGRKSNITLNKTITFLVKKKTGGNFSSLRAPHIWPLDTSVSVCENCSVGYFFDLRYTLCFYTSMWLRYKVCFYTSTCKNIIYISTRIVFNIPGSFFLVKHARNKL